MALILRCRGPIALPTEDVDCYIQPDFITVSVAYKAPQERDQPTLGRLERYQPASAARLRAEVLSHEEPPRVYKLECDRTEAAL